MSTALPTSIAELRCEHRPAPRGIDAPRPRLSWRLDAPAEARDVRQRAYQIRLAGVNDDLSARPLWDSGRVESDRTHEIPYAGPALRSGQEYRWQVRSWLAGVDQPTDWSAPGCFEMGLLEADAWSAHWIGVPARPRDRSQPCPYMSKAFALDTPVRRARLYYTARGVCEFHLNGRRYDDQVLSPGWTSFTERLQYVTLDVTDALREGDNVIGAILGDGWYAGHLGFRGGGRGHYGTDPQLLAQLVIETDAGLTHTIVSDASWRWTTGPLLASDIYHGEDYDARLELAGWATAGYDDRAWEPVVAEPRGDQKLVAKRVEPVRRIEELPAGDITEPRPGVWVIDLGQNMVGWARLRVVGQPGQTITMRFAEMLNPDGTIYTQNLRRAKQTDTYTCRGGGEEVYEPRFTFHGFRYVELTGMPHPPTQPTITGIVLHNDMRPTGAFECSHPLVNQLHHNIGWGQKGNYLEVPTDCPQRDERLGWTGDAQVFIRTACFHFDVRPFIEKWMDDVCDDQHDNGSVTHVAPDVVGGDGAAGWSDAIVIVPWALYQWYGDQRVLARCYEPMVRWIEYCRDSSAELIRPARLFGDWLAIDALRNPGSSVAPRDLIATAYFAYAAGLVAQVADVLGHEDQAKRHRDLREQIKQAFVREFVTPAGRLASHTQTALSIALNFDLLPDTASREKCRTLLLANLSHNDNHLTTGFLGANMLMPAVTDAGAAEVNYDLLLNEDYPSWLMPVVHGATTIWERWDGWRPDRGFQNPSMNSFNHYAYGCIGEWMYRHLAGLTHDPERPAYKHAIVAPLIDPKRRFTFAKATLQTPHGELGVNWYLEGDVIHLDATIPPNTTATIRLPAADTDAVIDTDGLKTTGFADGAATFDCGCGEYHLCARLSPASA